MTGRPGLTWPGVAPTPLCVSFPVLSIPLSTPSVCGMRECGSKKRKDDILTVVADLHRPSVFGVA